MKLELITPTKAINKAYLKEKIGRTYIELFKNNLKLLFSRINEQESEEHLKNVIADFLKDTWYKELFEVNTKDRNDLVIHIGKTTKEPVGVILEVKKPSNKSEMMTETKPNSKALQELILYYLRERFDHNNTDLKYLVITNIYEWYIIDEVWFEKNVFRNNKLKKDYENWKMSGKDTKFFYDSIAKSFLDDVKEEMPAAYFDVRNYEKFVTNTDKKDDTKLISLYKILSPAHLLKEPFTNDSNSLDTKFYTELLHLIGLEEIKDGSKKLIKRKSKSDRASLLENTIIKLEDKDALRNITNLHTFGANKDEQLFNVSLELCITWVNRVLFIKLLEGQLFKYHKGNKNYLFLNTKLVHDFDELSNLFFQVLAEKPGSRRNHIQEKFSKVPYLNSSLFERTELERQTINISELDNRLQLPLSTSTVLKDDKGKRQTGSLSTLQYLFEFLDAYDFTSDGGEEIQEENKNLINASVLGLIFEKINGYKDGSFFTPGFVTMFMCKETIRRSIIQKFNDSKGWKCETIDNLYNKITDKKEANQIINNLRICDPAVGSGHFLVSALNEIIAIKSELKTLQDAAGKSLRDYHVEVVNDELTITDEDGKLFDYNPNNKESQRVQETLFHEKETIIENCLFGVDINANSVKICRLRLWIELLKNAYYTSSSNYLELETLPNIDINIKCGNSLISRFALDVDIKNALRNSKWTIESYKTAVQIYRDAESKEQKREMEDLINIIKNDFRSYISPNDSKYKKLSKLRGDLFNLSQTKELFVEINKISKDTKKKVEQLSNDIAKLENEIEEIKNNKIYENAFEWRFEFPEVLNDDGAFNGFDVVIGNPPYVQIAASETPSQELKQYLIGRYKSSMGRLNTFGFFTVLGIELLQPTKMMSFILPNTILMQDYYDQLRNIILNETSIKTIVLFDDLPFEEAVVENSILTLEKSKSTSESVINVLRVNNSLTFKKENQIQQSLILNNRKFTFNINLSESNIKLIQKLSANTSHLGEWTEINQAIALKHERSKWVFNEIKDETFKPLLVGGKNINRYSTMWDGSYLKYDLNGIHSCKREDIFLSAEKIFFRRVANKIIATLDKNQYYALHTLVVINNKHDSIYSLNYILGILNSKLMNWYYQQMFSSTKTVFTEIGARQVELLPIKNESPNNQLVLVNLVNKVLEMKEKDTEADTEILENEIDNEVYRLYDLEAYEIKIIEDHA